MPTDPHQRDWLWLVGLFVVVALLVVVVWRQA